MTKVIEVIEEGEVTTVEPELEKSESNNSLMIIIPAVIVGALVVVIGVMSVRYFINKNKPADNSEAKAVAAAVKTDIVDVQFEPQFILDADDSKNIFAGRPSTAPLSEDIERSEQKKPRKKTKKLVVRKRKQPGSSSSDKPIKEGN